MPLLSPPEPTWGGWADASDTASRASRASSAAGIDPATRDALALVFNAEGNYLQEIIVAGGCSSGTPLMR